MCDKNCELVNCHTGVSMENAMLKISKLIIIFSICFIICACIPIERLKLRDGINKIEIGMTKEQVTSILGEPKSTSATGNITFMRYYIENLYGWQESNAYFVELQNNKVVKYGQLGDFNSTQSPTVNENINIKSN